ncbi:MAG: enoyl-CoA hydratase/isomerase family protein [Deltaproteobacteria bacterium]|nr:enoyl-CoA hydratase/isomerase family protein [Deltaproteobacteria bacterium]
MTPTKIRIETFLDGEAVRIVLDAPPANVLDSTMMAEITATLDELRLRPELKLLCFAAEGKHFSFGASVEEHVGERARGMLAAFHGMFARLAALALPTVAVVRGRCLGGAMELAAFCNWVYAAPGAIFAQPEIQLAVFAPVASLILPRKLGQARADDINLTGRNVDAAAAKAMGLVDVVAENPEAALEEWARRELLSKSAAALRFANRASRLSWNHALATELETLEALYLDELMATADANEGLAAFIGKRKPVWKNA